MRKSPFVVLAGAVVVSFAVAGCADDNNESVANPPAAAGEEVGTDEAAATSTKYYDCNGGDGDQMTRIEMGINGTTLSLTDLSKDAAPPDSGRIDRDYHPTSAMYRDAKRYSGFPKLVDMWDEVGSVDIIVSKEIQDNAAQGKVWMRTAGGSGGDTTQYWCKSKAKKLAVKTSLKSRLMCDLHLVCTNDNPPGDTCLSEAFINEVSPGKSTLRTTYLDHFGVNVHERRVNVGSSTSMNRTTRSFKAEWNGHKLDVTYRAGVTYIGKLTLPDGRTTDAQCNDLAMFD